MKMWSYIGKKDKNVPAKEQGQFGIGQRVDLDRAGRRYKAGLFLDDRYA
jgi:hypothetical protein